MGLDLNFNKDGTILSDKEKDGLLIPTITTREELDEFEQQNIEKAVEFYLLRRKYKAEAILTEKYVFNVHKRMLGDVWDWAGTIRKTNKNLGIDLFQISPRLHQLLENCKYWIEHKTFSEEEIALRFKHEIVSIHVFPNGNGRHSRLMGDIIMKHIFKKPIFSWGQKDLVYKNEVRDNYIDALRKADNGDFTSLLGFSKQ